MWTNNPPKQLRLSFISFKELFPLQQKHQTMAREKPIMINACLHVIPKISKHALQLKQTPGNILHTDKSLTNYTQNPYLGCTV